VEEAGGILTLARDSVVLAEGICTSGEINRETTTEKVEGFWTIKEHQFIGDTMPDDQALLVNVQDKGLAVITGCAHAGIINTIRHARKLLGIDRIYAVIGGFHLDKAGDERIETTVTELTRLGPEIVAPCHCTGFDATRRLVEAFGDSCHPLRTGDILNL
jgi:7,8-dihydropterin-6-yl-methyl-4-(beta-D-ribofuranosyl)aminobenzene 5'-phosphate synthase